MEFLEKNLEDIIWESDREKLFLKGLAIEGVLKRQLRIGNYGIIDLVSFCKYNNPFSNEPFLNITIYELKKDRIGVSAFLQSVNYAKGIKSWMQIYKPYLTFNINLVLIGREIDSSGSFIYLEDLFRGDLDTPNNSIASIEYYTYNYGIDGLDFKLESNYNLINKGF